MSDGFEGSELTHEPRLDVLAPTLSNFLKTLLNRGSEDEQRSAMSDGFEGCELTREPTFDVVTPATKAVKGLLAIIVNKGPEKASTEEQVEE